MQKFFVWLITMVGLLNISIVMGIVVFGAITLVMGTGIYFISDPFNILTYKESLEVGCGIVMVLCVKNFLERKPKQ